ncbi:MAG: hypothetical protein ACOC9T_00120 [Myxococcota bacterium]
MTTSSDGCLRCGYPIDDHGRLQQTADHELKTKLECPPGGKIPRKQDGDPDGGIKSGG